MTQAYVRLYIAAIYVIIQILAHEASIDTLSPLTYSRLGKEASDHACECLFVRKNHRLGEAPVSTVIQSPEIKRAISVSVRVNEIAEEVSAERHEQFCTNVQALVWSCVGLARHWRSLVEFISTSANCGKHIDYRAAGEILRPAAERTLTIYSDVDEMTKGSSCRLQDVSDLTLAIIEAGNTMRWLDSWPTHDDSRRNAARESFARGEFCTDDDLVG